MRWTMQAASRARWLWIGVLLGSLGLAACQTSAGDCVHVTQNFTLRTVAYNVDKHSAWIVGVQDQSYCPVDGAVPEIVQILTINLDDLTFENKAQKQSTVLVPATPSGYKLLYVGAFSPLSCLACDFTVRVGDTHTVHVYADPQSVLRLDLDDGTTPVLQFRIDAQALVQLKGTP